MTLFPPEIQAMFDDPAYWVSNRRHKEVGAALDRAYRSALAGAVECEPHLRARFLDQHGVMAQLPWLAWDDDPRGGYWISLGICHEWREPEAEWETFLWANYMRDSEDGTDHDVYERAFEMTQHVNRDARQLVEVTMRGLRDHRSAITKESS